MQIISLFVLHPSVADSVTDVGLLELAVDDPRSIADEHARESLSIIMAAHESPRLVMAKDVLAERPLHARFVGLSRLLEELETTDLDLIWRMRAQLALLLAGSVEDAWAECSLSSYGTLEGEWLRLLETCLQVLEDIVGGKWTSSRAFAKPAQVKAGVVGLQRLIRELMQALRKLESSDGSQGRLAVRRARTHGRAYVAAVSARRIYLDLSTELQEFAEASLRIARFSHAAEGLLGLEDAEITVPLLLGILPSDAETAVRALCPSADAIVKMRMFAAPATVSLFDTRLRELDDIAKVGLPQLIDDLSPRSTTADEAVDLRELAALCPQQQDDADDEALAPVLVKQYQGDEFRDARARLLASANPRLPSVHLDSWTGDTAYSARQSAV